MPITAWEQAVFVTLFVVMLLVFLCGFYVFAKAMLKQLQDFITARDLQWQKFTEDREQSFKERNAGIVNVLEKLVTKFDEHDEMTRQAVTTMEERTRPVAKAGRKIVENK